MILCFYNVVLCQNSGDTKNTSYRSLHYLNFVTFSPLAPITTTTDVFCHYIISLFTIFANRSINAVLARIHLALNEIESPVFH